MVRLIKARLNFSAKKIDGKKREHTSLQERESNLSLKKVKKEIYGVKILNHDFDNKKSLFVVSCESGTYVRSLAKDIATELKTFVVVLKL